MFARLALLFIVVPVVELLLLIEMGQWIGLLPTIALVMTTGVVGAFLARMEGFRVLLGARKEVLSGRVPTDSLMNGVCILIGGALLLTPGILTDLLGFSLLLPFTRGFWARRLGASLERGIQKGWIKASVVGGPWGRGARGPGPEADTVGPDEPTFAPAEVVETIVPPADPSPVQGRTGN